MSTCCTLRIKFKDQWRPRPVGSSQRYTTQSIIIKWLTTSNRKQPRIKKKQRTKQTAFEMAGFSHLIGPHIRGLDRAVHVGHAPTPTAYLAVALPPATCAPRRCHLGPAGYAAPMALWAQSPPGHVSTRQGIPGAGWGPPCLLCCSSPLDRFTVVWILRFGFSRWDFVLEEKRIFSVWMVVVCVKIGKDEFFYFLCIEKFIIWRPQKKVIIWPRSCQVFLWNNSSYIFYLTCRII